MSSPLYKKEPIVIVMPEKYKDRDFKITFDKHAENFKSVFIMDLEKMKPKIPDAIRIEPMLDPHPFGYKFILHDVEKET